MNIALYFGSFNPIHTGHLIIANFVAHNTNCDKVWFVVSPQNPLKPSATLLNEYHRLHMVRLAIEDNTRLAVSDVEYRLPKPSYTIDTLTYLNEKYPNYTFTVLIGSDSFHNIGRWKNASLLLQKYSFIIYNRPDFEISNAAGENITILSAPFLDISATLIRNLIKEKKSIQYLVPDLVRYEIERNNYYRG